MSKLITDEYREILAWEHANTPGNWGQTAKKLTLPIVMYAEKLNVSCLLDYGAGHGGLRKQLEVDYPGQYQVFEYEPSDPDRAAEPDPCDYVVCVDVLEHIEPELLESVLKDLARVTKTAGFFTVSTRPAGKILKDGRNAHLIVEPFDFWYERLESYFTIEQSSYDPQQKRGTFYVRPK